MAVLSRAMDVSMIIGCAMPIGSVLLNVAAMVFHGRRTGEGWAGSTVSDDPCQGPGNLICELQPLRL